MNNNRRFTALLFTLIIFTGSILAFAGGDTASLLADIAGDPKNTCASTEEYLSANLPLTDLLRQLNIRLRLLGGLKEKDGLYILSDSLVKDLRPDDAGLACAEQNTQTVIASAEAGNTPTSIMLIPTACAVYQEKLPESAYLYDQKGFIESVYRQMSGKVSAVSLYPVLFSAREDYLYYRTSDLLTQLGGYKTYEVLAGRLGVSSKASDSFTISPLSVSFRGELCDRWSYGGVKPDIISAWDHTDTNRLCTVTHTDSNGGQRVYHTLYPTEAAAEGSELCMILGGVSPRVDIETENLYTTSPSLLVYGDEMFFQCLPFLALNFQRITFIDISAGYSDADPSEYDRVLFSCSVESYMEYQIRP